MNEQREYRAIPINSKDFVCFVYGWYFYEKLNDKHYILVKPSLLADYRFDAIVGHIEVIPESVEQFTGRWDTDNNKKIFHKDIVEIRLKNGHKRIGIIEWVEKECSYIINVFKATDGETGAHSVGYSGSAVLGIKVIGNALQNPNLLK